MAETMMDISADDLLYEAWAVIANAGWDGAGKPEGWQEAAVRWRDKWHAYLSHDPAASSAASQPMTEADVLELATQLPGAKVVAWCPKHNWSRNHTDALYLCAKGSAMHDPCGRGVRVLVLPPLEEE